MVEYRSECIVVAYCVSTVYARPLVRDSLVYDQDFGVSVLVPIMVSLFEDQTIASAVAHMSQEASIPVLHIAGLREAIAGGADPDEASALKRLVRQVRATMSVFRLLMLDEPGRETYERVAASFAGLKDILETYQHRVAAARKDSSDSFLGQPAHWDAINWRVGHEKLRNDDGGEHVPACSNRRCVDLMRVLARHVGIRTDPPEYEWLSLLELSDQDIALAAKTKAEALDIAVKGMWMDEDEAREAINGSPVFGDVTGPAPEIDPLELPIMQGPGTFPAGNGNGAKPKQQQPAK